MEITNTTKFLATTMVVLFSFLSIMTYIMQYEAHADGFSQENVFASIGNRKMAMFIKINPPILTSQNMTDRYVQFRFYDANTNNTIQNVSFFLNVTKGNQMMMYDLFYTKDGYMTIEFQPGGEAGKWTVFGDKDPITGGWYSETDQVSVQSPILSQGGLYHFNMNLLSFDYPNEFLPPNTTVSFDSYLSVGDFSNTTINYDSKPYDLTLVSYYDKTQNINFDPSKLQVSWSMPFDWDPSRYGDRPFLVHEELRMPDSFRQFVETPTFAATVNGVPMSPNKIVLDTYSIPNTTIVHLFVNKQDMQKLSAVVSPRANTMDFTVMPSHVNVSTSTEIFTDFGGWQIKLGWDPPSLDTGSANNLNLAFFDQLTGQPVQNDINYNLQLLDSGGGIIFSKSNLVAKGGTDTVLLNLPSNGVYTIKLGVTSFVNSGVLDTSRNGVARGNVIIPSVAGQQVVPEFPENTALVLIVGTVSIILLSARSRLISSYI